MQALKAALANRDRQLVVNIDYSSASLVQFIARELADVIFVDCEQGDTSIETIPDLVRAAQVEKTPILVRLPDPRPETIERFMFRGVDGIVVPRLETPADASAVLDVVRYCYGDAAEEKVIVVQIESIGAAQSIDAFLELTDIDALFVGPVDLARSMGKAGRYEDPEVAEVIEGLIARIVNAGRSAGMLATAQSISSLERQGVNFLYLHTNDFLRHGRDLFVSDRRDLQTPKGLKS